MKTKLAIFDLDGTLFDTKEINYNAYKKSLDDCGFECNIDYMFFCNFCNGNNYRVFLPEIVSNITDDEMTRVHEMKKLAYPEFLHLAKMNQHLFQFIDLIRDEYNIALVTTASRKNTEDILKKFSVNDKFDLIITQEDVTETKPSPECFYTAMEKLNVRKEETLIFEDSDTGIEAAIRSGAYYVRVYGFN